MPDRLDAKYNAMRKHAITMGWPGYSAQLWLAVFVLFLAGCAPKTVAPRSQIVLLERSLQTEVLPAGIWTLSFDYRFAAETSSDSTGTLWMSSALTINARGVKAVRIVMYFVDADGKVLGDVELLDISSFPANPAITNHQFSTPPGTVALGFQASVRGGMPPDG